MGNVANFSRFFVEYDERKGVDKKGRRSFEDGRRAPTKAARQMLVCRAAEFFGCADYLPVSFLAAASLSAQFLQIQPLAVRL